MDHTILNDRVQVALHPLSIVRGRDGEHEVGRADTGVFISVPPEGLDLIGWLRSGLPLGKVKEAFAERYGEPPDVEDFLAGLAACGFVQAIDGRAVTDIADMPAARTRKRGWQVLADLPAERVRWLISRPMLLCYLTIWLTVPALFLLRPDVLPSLSDAVIFPRMTANIIVLAVLGWGLLSLHELAHVVVARAHGCDSSLSIGHRLYFLVAQTDLTTVRALPHHRRYGPYLAGVTWDMTVVLACSLLRLAGIQSSLVAALAYLALMGVMFQCAFFLRTDGYLVLVNWLRLGNLMEDSRHWLVNLGHRILGRPGPYDLSQVPVRELRIIRWYAGFHFLAVLVLLAGLVVFGLPVLAGLLRQAATDLTRGPTHAVFWDGLGFLVLATLNVGLMVVVWRRDHLMREVMES